MMTCQHARRMFDRYLDDELSPSLQTEFHAHVVNCGECQNELAVFEALGDVIHLDHSEPVASAGFTDRVLVSCQLKAAPSPRRWRRVAMWTAGPMAAAAVLAMVVLPTWTSWQTPPPKGPTVIGSETVSAPKEFVTEMVKLTDRPQSPQAQRELAETPEMPALSFMDALLAPLVEGTRNTVEGTRRSAQDVELLIRFGFENMNERLVAEYRAKYPEEMREQSSGERVLNDLHLLDIALPKADPPAQESPAAGGGESLTADPI